MKHLTQFSALLLVLCLTTPALAQQKQWPLDARAVSYTIAAELSGQRGVESISFAPGVKEYLAAASYGEYTDFTRSRVAPLFYENKGTGNNYPAEVGGSIHLLDQYGRIVSFQYTAQYTVNGRNIHVTQALAAMTSPTNLSLETYMVPMADFKTQITRDRRSHWPTVYQFAKTNAYNSSQPDSGKQEFLVMTFVKNRLPEDAKFEVVANTRKTAKRTMDNLAKRNESYLDYDGWRVHMFAAKLKPSSMNDRFYSNYFYTPGAGIPEESRSRIHVASFSSKPSGAAEGGTMQAQARSNGPAHQSTPAVPPPPGAAYQPAPAQQPVIQAQSHATTSVASAGQAPGPYERGMALLNPIFPEDVAIIQVRLKELGYYRGPLDQDFGPMTKKALDRFNVKHGFPKGQWSLGIQKALFKGTGL